MLKRLTIKNVALIDYMQAQFDDRLNILSGETGAGKSIIVDSLFLLLGAKYDKTLLSFGASSGYVEGVFATSVYCNRVLDDLLIEHEDSQIIVVRRFDKEGKSDIRINGQSVTLAMLRTVMNTLVDIYGQNQHLTLLDKSSQLRLVEFFDKDNISIAASDVADKFGAYKATIKEIDSLGDTTSRLREIELLKSTIEEIESANVATGEESALVERRRVILSSDKTKEYLGRAVAILCESESNVSQMLSACKAHIGHIKDYDIGNIATRVASVLLEIDDIGYAISTLISRLEGDDSDVDNIERRLEIVRRIGRKYGDKDECDRILIEARDRLDILSDADNLGQRLARQLLAQKQELYKASLQLSSLRKVAAQSLKKALATELDELGMVAAQFEVRFDDTPSLDDCASRLGHNGLDNIEFYLSTNKGQPIKPLAKVISGGEMSRFMLAIKVIVAQIESIDTLIFDEIDTGISGVIGQAVAKKLAKISRHKQVLCVSHLAQIVAMADKNYLITKTDVDQKTTTSIAPIDAKAKTREIARLSGGLVSNTAISAAKEIISNSDEYKKSIR